MGSDYADSRRLGEGVSSPDLPPGWKWRDSGVAYLWCETFELCVRSSWGDNYYAFMRANDEAYELGDNYKTPMEAALAISVYAAKMTQKVAIRLNRAIGKPASARNARRRPE